MKQLSLTLFTLTVLLALTLSAATNALNQNEVTKDKATESRYLSQRNASSFYLLPSSNSIHFFLF